MANAIRGMAGNAGAMAVCALAGDLEAVRRRMGMLEERFEALRKMVGG